MKYQELLNINRLNFENKKVLVIGGGWMGKQYCTALRMMGVKDISVITRSEETAKDCREKFKCNALPGGYLKNLPLLSDRFDLVIIAVPIHELISATVGAINVGYYNILVEKPGALYSSVLEKVKSEIPKNVRVRIAYNRVVYPTLWKLIDILSSGEEITSCFYTFTEWIHTINFNNNKPEVYQRWGISNSLHVISMAHFLIGMPKQISVYRNGGLEWHPTSSCFTGAGITEKGIPFSYHADWKSAGRWGIDIMTDQDGYRLMPLEKLYYCKKKSVEWEEIPVNSAYSDCKMGVAEEIAIMLYPELENLFPLITLEQGIKFIKLAEAIFGYYSRPSK